MGWLTIKPGRDWLLAAVLTLMRRELKILAATPRHSPHTGTEVCSSHRGGSWKKKKNTSVLTVWDFPAINPGNGPELVGELLPMFLLPEDKNLRVCFPAFSLRAGEAAVLWTPR